MCGKKRRVCCHCEPEPRVRSIPCPSTMNVQCCPPPTPKWDTYYPQPKRPPPSPCQTRKNKPLNVCYTPVTTCCKRDYPQAPQHRVCKRTPSGMDIYEDKDNESDDIESHSDVYGSEVEASKSTVSNYKVNFNDYLTNNYDAPYDRDSQAYYPNNYK